jgi:hypothetical protein
MECRCRKDALTRTGTEGGTRSEGAGAHAEARAEGRGYVAEEVAATRAAAVGAERSSDIGAEPVTAGFALRIDALHGEAGHELHICSLRGRKAQVDSGTAILRSRPKGF